MSGKNPQLVEMVDQLMSVLREEGYDVDFGQVMPGVEDVEIIVATRADVRGMFSISVLLDEEWEEWG